MRFTITALTLLLSALLSAKGPYSNLEFIGYYWSSSDFVTLSAYYRYIIYDDVDLTRATGGKGNGFSVRCLRD